MDKAPPSSTGNTIGGIVAIIALIFLVRGCTLAFRAVRNGVDESNAPSIEHYEQQAYQDLKSRGIIHDEPSPTPAPANAKSY